MGSSDDGDRLFHASSSDELSSFLRQILSPTPTAGQSFSPPYMVNQPQQPPKRIVHSVEMFDRTFPSDSGVAVSSVGYAVAETSEDRYAFQNKRNGGRQRNSLKKNIDAQLHNLSEKRRRRKINEKMKALQKVLPNSKKSDKASMLDEAIEYLKQLQLQVQTLAVMNGFGLNPMRLPPVLPPIHTRINETFKQEMNLESLPGASHSLVHREPAEGIQEMCFSTATLL